MILHCKNRIVQRNIGVGIENGGQNVREQTSGDKAIMATRRRRLGPRQTESRSPQISLPAALH